MGVKINFDSKKFLKQIENDINQQIQKTNIANMQLTKNEIAVLRHLSDGKHDKPEEMTEAQYYTAIQRLHKRGMVLAVFTEGENVYAIDINKSGQAALDDIDDSIEEEFISEQVKEIQPMPQTNMNTDLNISENNITNVICIIHAMWSAGAFNDADGKKPTIKKVMDTLGKALNAEKQFDSYSSYMNRAANGTENSYMKFFYDIENKASEFYKTKQERKKSKKIR